MICPPMPILSLFFLAKMSESLCFNHLSSDNYASLKVDMKCYSLLRDLWPVVVEKDVYKALDRDAKETTTSRAKVLMLVCTTYMLIVSH
jgi:hypothetical protein